MQLCGCFHFKFMTTNLKVGSWCCQAITMLLFTAKGFETELTAVAIFISSPPFLSWNYSDQIFLLSIWVSGLHYQLTVPEALHRGDYSSLKYLLYMASINIVCSSLSSQLTGRYTLLFFAAFASCSSLSTSAQISDLFSFYLWILIVLANSSNRMALNTASYIFYSNLSPELTNLHTPLCLAHWPPAILSFSCFFSNMSNMPLPQYVYTWNIIYQECSFSGLHFHHWDVGSNIAICRRLSKPFYISNLLAFLLWHWSPTDITLHTCIFVYL